MSGNLMALHAPTIKENCWKLKILQSHLKSGAKTTRKRKGLFSQAHSNEA
jgi:hypothetical protein